MFSLWSNPEQYDSYIGFNEGNNKTLYNSDAEFYFQLGKAMYKQGYRKFDAISLDEYLQSKPTVRAKYDEFGGYSTVKELMSLISPDNTDAYLDKIAKMNSLQLIAKKYEEIFNDVKRFDNASNDDVYNTFDLLNSAININTSNSSQIEDLVIDDEFLQSCNEGTEVGLSYAKGAPLLNYSTLGAPIGDIYLLAAHSGMGKTSFIFENMVLSFSQTGIRCAIISNEMRIESYKQLLLVHILTHDLGYYNLTRKKLKLGGFSTEDWSMLNKAKNISKEKYSNIKFVKLFDNNTAEVMRYIKRFKANGIQAIVWDTMKGDDSTDDKMWQQLLMNSRKIFNLISKEKLSMIVTFQLALYTTNQRYLDAGCLSSSKQVKEVVSELIMMRKLWADEYTGKPYDCKPYRFNRENHKIKETIELDEDKIYSVCFINKTRNGQDGITILFEWQPHYNKWIELGFCNIQNDHRGYN